MTNYKLYFKLLKKHMPQALIYTFFFCVIMITNINGFKTKTQEINKSTIYWLDERQDKWSKGLEQYLMSKGDMNVNPFPMGKETISPQAEREEIQKLVEEAVLLDIVDCAVRVPIVQGDIGGSNELAKVEIISLKDSVVVTELKQYIEAYAASKEGQQLGASSMTEKIESSMIQNQVQEESTGLSEEKYIYECIRFYFNVLVYGLSAVIIVGIISVVASLNAGKLRERRSCSPIEGNEQIAIMKCHFLFGLMTLILFLIPVFLLSKGYIWTIKGAMLCMNATLLTLNLIMLGYLFSLFINTTAMQVMATNVFSLGALFISGTIQEQSELNETAARIGQFIPTFWYIKGNNLIVQQDSIHEVLQVMGIEGLFFVTLGVISLVAKQQACSMQEEKP